MSTLLRDDRISHLASLAGRQINGRPRLVAVSGVMYIDPDESDRARLNAALATAASSRQANVPHLFMLDHKSAAGVSEQLSQAGAIVVPLATNEGGLALPYLTAAQIVDRLCALGALPGDVLLAKVEAEKNLFGSRDTPQHYLDQCAGLDIATGVRSMQTWQSMPHYLGVTESVLGYVIGQLLGISDDTPSGVLVLGAEGRHTLLDTTDEDSWTYLIRTPYEGNRRGLKVGSFQTNFEYHSEVTAEENGNARFDDKRRSQLALMFDYAYNLAIADILEIPDDLIRMIDRLRLALQGVASIG